MQELPINLVRFPTHIDVFLLSYHSDDNGQPQPVFHQAPLADLPAGRIESQVVLLEAHRRLAQVVYLDGNILTDILTVLLETVSSHHRAGEIPPLALAPPPPPHKRTAAHPRGFKGTKYRPPKLPGGTPMDLRPALCDRKQTRQLLNGLWYYKAVALEVLRKRLPSVNFELLAACTQAPVDPFVTVWFPRLDSEIRPRFAEGFLWACRGVPDHKVSVLSGAVERYLLRRPELSAAAAGIVATAKTAGVDWIHAAESFPEKIREQFLYLVFETGVARHVKPPPAVIEQLPLLEKCPHNTMHRVLLALKRGIPVGYLAAGLRLAVEYDPEYDFWRLPECNKTARVDIECLETLALHLPDKSVAGSVMALWQLCGKIPEVMTHLAAFDASPFSPLRLKCYLGFLTSLSWHGTATANIWKAVSAHLPLVQSLLLSIPEAYAEQAADGLFCLLDGWPMSPPLDAILPEAVSLLQRLSVPPFDTDGNMIHALTAFLRIRDPVLRRHVLDLPLANYRHLDKACRRQNTGYLIAWGLSSLLEIYPEFGVHAFEVAPTTLIRVCKLYGAYAWEARIQLVRTWKASSIVDLDTDNTPLEILVAHIQGAVSPRENPVPKALREHFEGVRQLKPNQLARHRRKLAAAMGKIRLLALEKHILDALKAGIRVPVDLGNADILFALRILTDAYRNKRSFRRFLQAYLAGDKTFLLEHPATRQWFKKHSELDESRWLGGFNKVFEIRGARVTLSIEQEPLEVLKMGQYVGSCLGLGGVCAYSAVAVLLDVNKQVIYARNENGLVMGRQLVAVSKQNELVPFSVYPEVSNELQAAFRQYDQALADTLGLPLKTDLDYEIELILAGHWWDDGVWSEMESE